MGTVIRPDISSKNSYWISKHRYYELKHFCLQYNEWKQGLTRLDGIQKAGGDVRVTSSNVPDPTWKTAEQYLYFHERMEMVERAAKETDPYLGDYVLLGVTEDLSYEKLNVRYRVPCGKDIYYKLYRVFFKILSDYRM